MGKYIIKKFGKNSLHIILRKSEGFKEGDVIVLGKDSTIDKDKLIKDIIEKVEQALDDKIEYKIEKLLNANRNW